MTFDFEGSLRLENEQVLLRPLEADDYQHLLEYAVNEPEIWRFNAWGAGSPAMLRDYIDRAIAQKNERTEYPFIVQDKSSGNYVGCTRFYDFQFERNSVQIGYTWYGRTYQGTQVNKNCKFLLLEYAFENLKVDRVGFGANAKNARSIGAMIGLGCTIEGTLRNYSLGNQGERIDVILLSILKVEWQKEVRETLLRKLSSSKS